jgi:AcrR family transcriptional regulator
VSKHKVEVAAPVKIDRRRAPKKKLKILDAAEAMFVQRGFYGTSLRDIAATAGVPLALLSYHFESKEGLFRAVVDRRSPENASGLEHALQAALALKNRRARLNAVLKAFVEPVIERSMRGGPGWKNYVRLLAQIANLPQQEAFVRPMPDNYEDTVRAFIDAMRSIYPKMAEADVQWSFYIFQAAFTHILAESGLVDRQSDGLCRSSDLDAIVPKLVQFCAAGIDSIAKSSSK